MELEYFFSDPNYHSVNTELPFVYKNDQMQLCYHIKNEVVLCPFKSSFCFIEGILNSSSFDHLLETLKIEATIIEWILPPLFYPKSQEQFNFLIKKGFKIAKVEVTQYLDLTKDFTRSLHYSKQKKLKKLIDSAIVTKVLENDHLDACYEMIAQNRSLKKYPLTMQKMDLKRLFDYFPDTFLLIGTYIKNELVSCSVTVRVSKTILYQFYWAHNALYDDICPLLYHNYWLSCEAKKWGITHIDFGVSTLDGTINRGLFRFKKQMGASASKKYYLSCNL